MVIGCARSTHTETPAAAVLLPACLQQFAAHSRSDFVCSMSDAAKSFVKAQHQAPSSNAPPARLPPTTPAPDGCAAPTLAPQHPPALPLPLPTPHHM